MTMKQHSLIKVWHESQKEQEDLRQIMNVRRAFYGR